LDFLYGGCGGIALCIYLLAYRYIYSEDVFAPKPPSSGLAPKIASAPLI
jgi:hypothetical protein